jgi:hypothetical protein
MGRPQIILTSTNKTASFTVFVVCGWREEAVAGVCLCTYLVHSTYVFLVMYQGYESRKNCNPSCTSRKYCKHLQFFFDASIIVPYVGISMFRRSKHTKRVIVCQNTMNHGGRRRTTAAMVPHSRLRCAETLANRLCNNAT